MRIRISNSLLLFSLSLLLFRQSALLDLMVTSPSRRPTLRCSNQTAQNTVTTPPLPLSLPLSTLVLSLLLCCSAVLHPWELVICICSHVCSSAEERSGATGTSAKLFARSVFPIGQFGDWEVAVVPVVLPQLCWKFGNSRIGSLPDFQHPTYIHHVARDSCQSVKI